ncbi:Uu.00g118900.m01.CDS01 [Anthostomella pinea]|uniref:Uu.00g118900.m01.CDS01 n=1 Tax=Anthostomella pinea TaxID=933095 RepID=A0AAI8VH77_9PEZI|nr:Uu.00g118900.m01.CDS01 [Anthostomella pinea]
MGPNSDPRGYIESWIQGLIVDNDDAQSWVLPVIARIEIDRTAAPLTVWIGGYCDFHILSRLKMDRVPFEGQLFDPTGKFKAAKWSTDPHYRGSGVWGSENDNYEMMWIERLFIKRQFRNRCFGRHLTRELTSTISDLVPKNDDDPYLFVVTYPDCLEIELQEELRLQNPPGNQAQIRERGRAAASRFYRSLGFRRVGSSGFFAWTSNPNHPSKALDAAHDYDPPADDYHPSGRPRTLFSAGVASAWLSS